MDSFDKITVVIPSAHSLEEKRDFLEMLNSTSEFPLDIVFIGHNVEGLTTVYQREFDKSENDLIIFMHDDIEFLKNGWGKKIVELFTINQEYGIIGLAGSQIYGHNDHLEWWANEDMKRGFLFHGTKEKSWATIMSPFNEKEELSEVVVVDGVFLACVKSRIKYGFDTNLQGFHFYDIDFCLANSTSKSCKIGVTDRIALRHESVGRPNEQWVANGLIVREKYKDKLPIRVLKHGNK